MSIGTLSFRLENYRAVLLVRRRRQIALRRDGDAAQ